MTKIFALLLALLLSATTAMAQMNNAPQELKTYGQSNAPVTFYVFSSLSCPHCSVFHAKVFPALMKEYVETGKAQIIWVDMPFDPKAMTGTMLARCLAPNAYDKFTTAMYENQQTWSSSGNAKPIITGYAKLLGMTDADIDTCLGNRPLQMAITQQRDNLSNLYGVRGMPSLAIVKNGQSKLLVGSDKDALLKYIKAYLAQ